MGHSHRAINTVLALLCLISLALTVFSFLRYSRYERSIVEPLKADLIERTHEAAMRIDASLSPAREAVEAMASRLDDINNPSEEQLLALLREAILTDKSCFGGAIAFEPYQFDPERELYAPYLSRKDGELQFVRIEEVYDYTAGDQEWYSAALEEGARWSEPYFDASIGDVLMTTYSAVFHHQDAPRGIVTIDVSMDAIGSIVRSLDLGGMGYSVLISDQGRFLFHPNEDLMLSGAKLMDMATQTGDEKLTNLAAEVLEGGSGIDDHTAPLTGLDTWFVWDPVPATGWSLITAFTKDDAPIDTSVLRRWQIVFGAGMVVFLSTLTALLLNAASGLRSRLWILSVVVSVLLVAGIGFTWQAALMFDPDDDLSGLKVTDSAGLRSFERTIGDMSRQRLTEPPVFVPTGVLIESLRFEGATDVDVRGYVWQRYDLESQSEIERGISFAGVAAERIGEPQIERTPEAEVLRWPFEISQRVRFENSKYPLMRERFALRIVPSSPASNLMLVPDLGAYPLLSPATRPGLDENVYLPGWEITRTFFELRERAAETSFGLDDSAARETFPSLYFNIEVRKEFVDTFVSNLVPLIIVAVVVFLVLMIIEREEEQILLMRAGPGFNLSICGTLLFVAVFAHIGARQKIAAQEIIYLEYFYIVMYFTLLWVAIDAILYVRCPNSKFLQYENNLLPKVLFWPFTLGAIWVVTLLTFY